MVPVGHPPVRRGNDPVGYVMNPVPGTSRAPFLSSPDWEPGTA